MTETKKLLQKPPQKHGPKCTNLKEVKSLPVLECEKNLVLKKPKDNAKNTSISGWLSLQKLCHITWHELLQKYIKYSKICLDSFLTVTTVLENWMLIQKTRCVYIQNIPDKHNKNILILPSILNFYINMQNMQQY